MEQLTGNGITVATANSAAAAVAVAHTESATTTATATVATAVAIKQQQQQRRRSLVPQGWEDQVRALGIAEHKEAALSLAQAFARDDLAQWLVEAEGDGDGDEARWRLHVDIFKYLVAQHCYGGAVTSIGPDYEGVALWVLPGQDAEAWTTVLRSGLWRLWWRLSPEGRRRYYEEFMPLLHQTKLDVLGGARAARDCYYLVYLGTKPSGRGRGYARKLIEQMTARADAEGRVMYLESSSAQNNAYYKKFGFEVKKDIHLGVAAGVSVSDNESSTSLSSLSSSASEPESAKSKPKQKPAVTLTIMVREPRRTLAHSIPIKLSGGFVGGKQQQQQQQ